MIKIIFFIAFILLISKLSADELQNGLDAIKRGEHKLALELFTRSCENSNAHGCNNLGVMYSTGDGGVMKDNQLAINAWKTGCELNNYDSCNNLGVLYSFGKSGIKKNVTEITSLFTKACDNNYGESCSNLAAIYYFGKLGTKDKEKAIALYKKACELKIESACKRYKTLVNG